MVIAFRVQQTAKPFQVRPIIHKSERSQAENRAIWQIFALPLYSARIVVVGKFPLPKRANLSCVLRNRTLIFAPVDVQVVHVNAKNVQVKRNFCMYRMERDYQIVQNKNSKKPRKTRK